MAVTRINNNQISDASAGNAYVGINAATKLQPYSITATKIANNLTYGSDLTVIGNLTVQGNTTAIDTTYTTIEDPILLLASTQTGTPSVDIGFVGERGTSNNIAFVWDESADEFVTVYTTTGESNTVISIASYADLHTGNANIGGNLTVNGTTTLIGNVTGNLSVTGNIAGANFLTAGLVSAGGNVSGAGATFTGNVTAQHFIGNIIGNIDAGGANTQVQFNDNELLNGSAAFTFDKTSNAVTITGNVTGGNLLTAGLVTATGNITGGNLITAGNVYAPAIINNGAYNTKIELGAASGIIAVTTDGNATQFLPAGQIRLGGAAQIFSGSLDGSQLVLGTAQTDLVQNRSGNVTVQVGTGGTTTSTWTFTNSGNLLAPGNISATGNVTGGNLLTGGLINATGNITSSANVDGANVNATSGITAGTTISATGNITGGNLATAGKVTATGNITSSANIAGGNLNVTGDIRSATIETTGNVLVGGNLTVQGNIQYINVDDLRVEDPIIIMGTGPNGIPLTSPDGMDRGIYMEWYTTGLGNSWIGWENSSGNLIAAADVNFSGNNVVNVNSYGTFQAGNIYAQSAVTTGNITGGNLSAGSGIITTTGNINGGNLNATVGVRAATGFFTGNVDVLGNLNASIGIVYANSGIFYGNAVNGNSAIFAGIPGYTPLGSNVVAQFAGNANSYSQLNFQNISNLTLASTDFIATADNGSDTTYYIDVGINSSTFNDPVNYPGFGPNDSYVHNHGGNLILNPESAGKAINFMIGGTDTTDVIGYVNTTGLSITGTIAATGNITGGNANIIGTTASTSKTTGALKVAGGVGVAGDLYAGNSVVVDGGAYGNVTTTQFASVFGTGQGPNPYSIMQVRSSDGVSGLGMQAYTGSATLYGNTNIIFALATIRDKDVPSNLITKAYIDSTGLTVTGIANISGNITGGNISTAGLITAAGNITGANLILTTGIIDGPASGRITINGSNIDTDFAVNGDTSANIFYVDAGTGTVSVGTGVQTTGAIFAMNSPTSFMMPVGNTSQRPGTGVTGMLRFNSTLDAVEVYDSAQWTTVGTPNFTVITDEQFNGDGSTVAFTLAAATTTNSTIVSINGIVQIPTLAYSVGGVGNDVLTFTEAPENGDIIDVRKLTTTTQVTSISNSPGNAIVQVNPTINEVSITGNLVPVSNVTQSLGSPTAQWKDIYVAGNTIYLGGLQLQASGNTFAVYTSDGVTQANVDVGNVDIAAINSGTSTIGISAPNGNAYITVGGTANVIVASTTGAAVTGILSVSGNIVSTGSNGVANIGSATTYFNTVHAKATSAQYADLAENYVADAAYAPGTVLSFGGEHEVTVSKLEGDRKIAGVVSTNPSYIMNSVLDAEHVATLALTGRVPTFVSGLVEKGDMMVSAGNGRAVACATPAMGTVIGKALENHAGGDGVIEVVVGRM